MLGIIGYNVASGIGTMCANLRRHLGIGHQLVIANDGFDPPYNFELSQGQHINGWQPSGKHLWDVQKADLQYWIEENKITTVVAVESSFGDNTFKWCRDLGAKVVLIPMWEFWHLNDPRLRNVDLNICISFRCFSEIPLDNKKYIPWPVDTNALRYRERSGPARTFVINGGTGGMHGRKGIALGIEGFIKAAETNKSIELLVRCQRPLHEAVPNIDGLLKKCDRVKVWYGNTDTVAELYATGDVLIAVHLLDGHFLVGEESLASGLPCIVTDAAPMNEIWPGLNPLAVKVERTEPGGLLNPHAMRNIVSTDDLAEKILWCASNDMKPLSQTGRKFIEDELSWEALKPRWEKALGEL